MRAEKPRSSIRVATLLRKLCVVELGTSVRRAPVANPSRSCLDHAQALTEFDRASADLAILDIAMHHYQSSRGDKSTPLTSGGRPRSKGGLPTFGGPATPVDH